MRVELVTTNAGLRDLADEWGALWRRVPDGTAFQSPAWLLPWWDVFGTDRPVLACLRDGDRLAGVLPLYVLGGEPRKLLPIGVGVSDYLDILIEPGVPGAADLLAAGVRAGFAAGAEVCDLVDIPPDSPLRGLPLEWQGGPACPVLTIPQGADWDESVPARQRRKLRMNRHRADRLGAWEVERATPATCADILGDLLRLNAGRWGGVSGEAERFYRASFPGLLRDGLLRLACLRVAGRVAACCAALTDGARRLMFYLIGFDPAFSDISPGSLLIGAMMENAARDGCREVHFLRGDEAYKYAWGARDRHNASCRILPA